MVYLFWDISDAIINAYLNSIIYLNYLLWMYAWNQATYVFIIKCWWQYLVIY